MLNTKCNKCNGKGRDLNKTYVNCNNCGGIGFIPTEEGREFLEFIKDHLFAELERRVEELENKIKD